MEKEGFRLPLFFICNNCYISTHLCKIVCYLLARYCTNVYIWSIIIKTNDMTIQEIKFNYIQNIKVNFYAASYQYRDSKMYSCENMNALEDVIKLTESMLRSGKNGATPAAQKDTFWATISIEKEVEGKLKYDEVFELRIKVN